MWTVESWTLGFGVVENQSRVKCSLNMWKMFIVPHNGKSFMFCLYFCLMGDSALLAYFVTSAGSVGPFLCANTAQRPTTSSVSLCGSK